MRKAKYLGMILTAAAALTGATIFSLRLYNIWCPGVHSGQIADTIELLWVPAFLCTMTGIPILASAIFDEPAEPQSNGRGDA